MYVSQLLVRQEHPACRPFPAILGRFRDVLKMHQAVNRTRGKGSNNMAVYTHLLVYNYLLFSMSAYSLSFSLLTLGDRWARDFSHPSSLFVHIDDMNADDVSLSSSVHFLLLHHGKAAIPRQVACEFRNIPKGHAYTNIDPRQKMLSSERCTTHL